MVSRLLFLIGLLCSSLTFSQTQIGDDIDGENSQDDSGRAVAISSDGSIVAIGANRNDGNGALSGHVRIYENLSGVWSQIGQDIDGENADDRSGFSVAISSNGSIVAIGARENDGNSSNSGHVRIFENQSGVWTQIGQDINGENSGDNAGASVALSSDGTIIAIGAQGSDGNGNNSGHVRVFENQGGVWTQIGQDIEGESANDFSGFGLDISSDGTIVAIGSSNNNGINGLQSGHVRVYENQAGVWTQIGQDIDGEDEFNLSGSSLSLSSDGTTIAIGAPFNLGGTRASNGFEAPGHVRVYENQGGSWVQIGDDIDGENSIDSSGWSVNLSANGNILAIGAVLNSDNGSAAGHTRIYQNQGGNWTQVGVDIDGENADDQSGWSVSLSDDGNIVAIGAIGNDGNGFNAGHVRVFDLSGILSTSESTITNFSLYPNPARNNLNVSISESDILQQVAIFNSLGQQVLSATQESIDISSLSKGIYIVKVTTNLGIATQKLIIK